MGLFDLFGSKKKEQEEQEAIAQQRQEEQRIRSVEELKLAHQDLPWPTPLRLNNINIGNHSNTMPDPLTAERKDEIGQLIYEPAIKPEDVSTLNLTELTFLYAAHEVFHKKSELPDYEKNHRVIYNEILRRVNSAKEMYVLYEAKTTYPFLDGNCVLIYLDKEHAEAAAKAYNGQFHQIQIATVPGEGARKESEEKKLLPYFDLLFYLGAENLLVDNGWYKVLIKRSEISAPLNLFADPKTTPPSNPMLAFSLIDMKQEMTWPVKYDKRAEILQKKQERMFRLVKQATFLAAAQVNNGTQESDNTSAPKQIGFAVLNAKDKKLFPVFTDIHEYSKSNKDSKFKPIGLKFEEMAKFASGADGVIINPTGQGIVIAKAKIGEILGN